MKRFLATFLQTLAAAMLCSLIGGFLIVLIVGLLDILVNAFGVPIAVIVCIFALVVILSAFVAAMEVNDGR